MAESLFEWPQICRESLLPTGVPHLNYLSSYVFLPNIYNEYVKGYWKEDINPLFLFSVLRKDLTLQERELIRPAWVCIDGRRNMCVRVSVCLQFGQHHIPGAFMKFLKAMKAMKHLTTRND